ncbi:hypothetical protein JHK87_001000 [Glycine soja]|nr:hypothetical protein JHK87_001000 [Glycine soja]
MDNYAWELLGIDDSDLPSFVFPKENLLPLVKPFVFCVCNMLSSARCLLVMSLCPGANLVGVMVS